MSVKSPGMANGNITVNKIRSSLEPSNKATSRKVGILIKHFSLKKHLKLACLWSELRLSLNMSSSIQVLLLIYKEELRVIFQVLKLA